MLGIYIHIPFCERKCNYCAFSSFVMSDKEKEKYVDFLLEEIRTFARERNEKQKVDTIFFGGGTPSLLPSIMIADILKEIKKNFEVIEDAEVTIECNPNSLTEDKLKVYKDAGINRISIGVQSLNDEDLKFIGRLHDREGAIKAIQLAKRYFENVSCDMLIGLKNMDEEELASEIEILTQLGITHISTYMLQIEKGTVLAEKVKNEPALLPDDDESVGAYEKVVSFLAKKGFVRYEVSNFAKEGFECKHNLKYWSGEDYVGFGSAAHSFVGGQRYSSAAGLSDYYAHKKDLVETITTKEKIEEHIMLGLRCKNGISKSFLKNNGYDINENPYLKDFISRQIVTLSNGDDRLFLNPSYYGVNNYIIACLLPE